MEFPIQGRRSRHLHGAFVLSAVERGTEKYLGTDAALARRLGQIRERGERDALWQTGRERAFFASVFYSNKAPSKGIRWALQRYRNASEELGLGRMQWAPTYAIGLKALHRAQAREIFSLWVGQWNLSRSLNFSVFDDDRARFRRYLKLSGATLRDIGATKRNLKRLGLQSWIKEL